MSRTRSSGLPVPAAIPSTSQDAAPSDLQDLIGPPVLLPGEDAAQYAALAKKLRDCVNPQDPIEEILLDDYVAITWEIWRWRRGKDNLIKSSMYQGLAELLAPLMPFNERAHLSKCFAARDRAAITEVKRHLAAMGLGEAAIVGHTMALHLRELEAMETAIARGEVRRAAAFRDIALHREALAFQVRQATRAVESAEFRELDHAEAAE